MESKKITNSEELNKYYKIINTKLKKFTEMNIPHNKIANYLKKDSENFKAFINDDEELRNVNGIEKVLQDIIDDAYHAFKDGLFKKKKELIKKFENLINESIYDISELTKKDEYEHEKVLADVYKVSMSYIDLIQSDLHLYYVNDNGSLLKIIIFNKEEVNIIRKNIVKNLCNEIRKRTTKLLADKVISLEDLISQNEIAAIVSDKLTDEDIINEISENTGLEVDVKHIKTITLNSVEYFIFEVF